MNDTQLLELIGADPQAGLSAVNDRYGRTLLGRLEAHVRRRRYGNSDVEDVFQLALLRLLNPDKRRELRNAGGQILPWLTRWAYWRLDDRARERPLVLEVEPVATDPDPSPSVSEVTLAVRRVLHLLRPRDRAILRWRYEENLGNAEVASRLGITEGAAKKAAHDARERLRALLEEVGFKLE
jgi:RNA polymerase sigma factor (sigma-70 family)